MVKGSTLGASISGLQESIDSWKVALDSGPRDLSYELCLVEFAPAQAELYLVKLKNVVFGIPPGVY